jgi:transposase-like protein
MKRVRYPAQFKAEAVKQVSERGHGVVNVAKRLGMLDKSLYLWVPRSSLALAVERLQPLKQKSPDSRQN